MKKILPFFLIFVMLVGMTVNVNAGAVKPQVYAIPEGVEWTEDDIVIINADGVTILKIEEFERETVVGDENSYAPRIQRSYIKVITLHAQAPKNSSYDYFPQSVYFSEPCPYAPGNAHGTLYLNYVGWLYDYESSNWAYYELDYGGYMYYYVN